MLAEPARQRDLEDLLRTAIGDEHGAVTDVSAQRTALSVSGPAAREVLARGCAIDLDPRYAPAGTCVQTLLARTGVTIVVRDERASEFLLLVRASFAEYLFRGVPGGLARRRLHRPMTVSVFDLFRGARRRPQFRSGPFRFGRYGHQL